MIEITDWMLPNWNKDLWSSDYKGIQVVKDVNIKDGYKVYVHNVPDDGHCVYIGLYKYVEQLQELASAMNIEYNVNFDEKKNIIDWFNHQECENCPFEKECDKLLRTLDENMDFSLTLCDIINDFNDKAFCEESGVIRHNYKNDMDYGE